VWRLDTGSHNSAKDKLTGRTGVKYQSEAIVTTNTKTDVLYEQVREKIIQGEIKPGAILTESELADENGVSRAPVREALVLLAHEGFVESMPRIGYVVASFSVQDVLEIFHLRSVLETEAAGLAAERITEEEIAALLKNSKEESALLDKTHEGRIYERGYELNMEFHQLIARASGHCRLADLIKRLMEDMQRILAFDPRFVEPRQHMEIIEALKQRDRTKAEQAMTKHVEQTKSRLMNRF
jgi:DNA-binding GntR family transcriptional regulator